MNKLRRYKMKRRVISIISIIALVGFFNLHAQVVPTTHLVTTKWLAENLNSPNLVIVDVRSKDAYNNGHIPGAVSMPEKLYFQKGYMGNIKHLLDTPNKVTEIFRNAGISNNSVVVFYASGSKKGYTNATRVFWTAWMYGLRNIAILNGGIDAWVWDNRPLSKKTFIPSRGDFTITTMSLGSIATWPDLYYALATKKVQLVDDRGSAHFKGIDHDKRLPKHGHIPGAIWIPYYRFVKKVGNHYELLNSDKVKMLLEKYKVSVNKPIIVYCNTGHLATGAWFAIKFLGGARNTKMYDASMYGYTRSPLPVVK